MQNQDSTTPSEYCQLKYSTLENQTTERHLTYCVFVKTFVCTCICVDVKQNLCIFKT